MNDPARNRWALIVAPGGQGHRFGRPPSRRWLLLVEAVPGFAGTMRRRAGFGGCVQVFAGLAGIAGRQLVMHASDLIFGIGQGGGGRRDLAAQRCGPFDQHAGVRWQLLQVLPAVRCRPVDLRLLSRRPGRRPLERGLAPVKAFPAGGQPGPRPPDGLKRLSLQVFRAGPEQSCPFVLPPLPFISSVLAPVGHLLPFVLPPVALISPPVSLISLQVSLISEILTLAGHLVPLISETVAPVGLALALISQTLAPAG